MNKKITRKSTLNLSYSTKSKLNKLDLIIEEYKKVVNIFIYHYLNEKKLPKYADVKEVNAKTWLSFSLQQCAGLLALQIIRGIFKKDKNVRYRHYKKVYAYFKRKNRQIKFLDKRFKELKLNKKLKPVYKSDAIRFDQRFVEIQEVKNSKLFELWIHLKCIGNKIILDLPTNKNEHYNKFKDWKRLKSATLKKVNNKLYLDVFFEKEVSKTFTGDKELGLDLGINKLISLSDGRQYGMDFKKLLYKLNRRKQDSKRWNRTLIEIKDFIAREINQIDFLNLKLIVKEDLRNISIRTKKDKKVGKVTRKLLSKWNLGEFNLRLKNKCEISRTEIALVNPRYTSRTCPKCGFEDKKNRRGEYFNCIVCGYSSDADINGAVNILQRFYQLPRFTGSGKEESSQDVVLKERKEIF